MRPQKESEEKSQTISVAIRMRPLFQEERPGNWKVDENNSLLYLSQKQFPFSKLYLQSSSNSDVYNESCKPIIQKIIQGQNGKKNVHEHIARSHFIYRLTIENYQKAKNIFGYKQKSVLTFLDLANSDPQINENTQLNFPLDEIVRKILDQNTADSYYLSNREAFYLRSALGQSDLATIICTMSPSEDSVDKSIQILNFASCIQDSENIKSPNPNNHHQKKPDKVKAKSQQNSPKKDSNELKPALKKTFQNTDSQTDIIQEIIRIVADKNDLSDQIRQETKNLISQEFDKFQEQSKSKVCRCRSDLLNSI
ncbi:atp binding microtubule motor family isoform 1 [Stylonychia lemnae]|uniref:Atp binding microtubule motor family isoform 1 n=1 Tax=Stylonychia lemnae TaxID=5949 RepID=A0A077ZMT8_STYLE|nr:atp binding microtubule motor family isoform 1 [Stylonychia lemnae]|eukprot:CDW71282.1 atp binding microtubule motor family isoform 1 [Stylonychia lemnae]